MSAKNDDARFIKNMGTKTVRHLEKPKPLNLKSSTITRHSAPDVPQRMVVNILGEVMNIVEKTAHLIAAKNFQDLHQTAVTLAGKLKVFGVQLEEFYKDQLDRAFLTFRDAAKDCSVDSAIRIILLELVELRAMHWQIKSPSFSNYFNSKHSKAEQPIAFGDINESQLPSPVLHLAPGEVIKPSGKYPSPTKLQGKNYCKDEVIIRNADSGKVMGIKGRRVHMIEELSETVISFQRVNPGAKERLVQITGPTEEKIILARNLIEDTIKRNASPVRELSEKDCIVGSSSSLNSSASDDLIAGKSDGDSALFGYEPNDCYIHTVLIGKDHLTMVSDNFNAVSEAKLVLDKHFALREGGSTCEIGIQCSDRDLISSLSQDDENDLIDGMIKLNYTSAPKNAKPVFQAVKRVPSEKNVAEKSPYIPPDCEPVPSRPNGVRYEYSREFLLELSESPASQLPPRHWSIIAAEFPNISKQNPRNFDPTIYLKAWKSMDPATSSVIGETWSDSD